MVAARAAFLAAGHYAPITDALVAAARAVTTPGCVVDVGAGTGHHLAAVLDGMPGREGIALDVSTSAARIAARAHPRAGAVVGDAWRRFPVRDNAAAVVLDVFAPRHGAEIARVLHPHGSLVVVVPTGRHLRELVGPLRLLTVDPEKEQRLDRTLGPHLRCENTVEREFWLRLDRPAVTALVGMGPSVRHADLDALGACIATLPDPLAVTASVAVSTWRHGTAGGRRPQWGQPGGRVAAASAARSSSAGKGSASRISSPGRDDLTST